MSDVPKPKSERTRWSDEDLSEPAQRFLATLEVSPAHKKNVRLGVVRVEKALGPAGYAPAIAAVRATLGARGGDEVAKYAIVKFETWLAGQGLLTVAASSSPPPTTSGTSGDLADWENFELTRKKIKALAPVVDITPILDALGRLPELVDEALDLRPIQDEIAQLQLAIGPVSGTISAVHGSITARLERIERALAARPQPEDAAPLKPAKTSRTDVAQAAAAADRAQFAHELEAVLDSLSIHYASRALNVEEKRLQRFMSGGTLPRDIDSQHLHRIYVAIRHDALDLDGADDVAEVLAAARRHRLDALTSTQRGDAA